MQFYSLRKRKKRGNSMESLIVQPSAFRRHNLPVVESAVNKEMADGYLTRMHCGLKSFEKQIPFF